MSRGNFGRVTFLSESYLLTSNVKPALVSTLNEFPFEVRPKAAWTDFAVRATVIVQTSLRDRIVKDNRL